MFWDKQPKVNILSVLIDLCVPCFMFLDYFMWTSILLYFFSSEKEKKKKKLALNWMLWCRQRPLFSQLERNLNGNWTIWQILGRWLRYPLSICLKKRHTIIRFNAKRRKLNSSESSRFKKCFKKNPSLYLLLKRCLL